MSKKDCVAMLLAGGQGSRLGVLTRNNAKPAVSFGGKYRIIDFTLSNCTNSEIDTVGVLTQYKPLVLNHYVGNGEAWDLDSNHGGVHILPPYATESGGQWYNGTADAVYQNIDYLDSYNPDNVLILSGDHLYKMNYRLMLDEHIKNDADLTVSVIQVPIEDASRFGILEADETGRIIDFQEKPEKPKSDLASMGIYIFKWPVLRKALLIEHSDPESDKDFGKNIIPNLLKDGKKLFAYKFSGYWKDIGTIDSYYEANMSLMEEGSGYNVFECVPRVYSNSNIYPPYYVSPTGSICGSLVANGCTIEGKVVHSIISSSATVEEGAVVEDSIVLPNAYVGKNCHLVKTIVDENTILKPDLELGSKDGEITVVGKGSEFSEN